MMMTLTYPDSHARLTGSLLIIAKETRHWAPNYTASGSQRRDSTSVMRNLERRLTPQRISDMFAKLASCPAGLGLRLSGMG